MQRYSCKLVFLFHFVYAENAQWLHKNDTFEEGDKNK